MIGGCPLEFELCFKCGLTYPGDMYVIAATIRLDVNYLGENGEGQCCYELEFVNNSPFRLNANDLNFDFKDANVTNVANEEDLILFNTLGEDRLSWID